jgi:predicted RNA-binding protein
MCQLRAVMETDGQTEKIMENVILVEVLPKALRLSTYFDEPKELTAVSIKSIDMVKGVLTLTATAAKGGTS